MSSPDDGSEPRSASERSTGASGSVTSPGGTRTPPPRTRRGAPASRPAPPDLVEPEATEVVREEPPKSATSRTKRAPTSTTTSTGPKAAPGSSKTFDWDDPAPARTTAATVTAAATSAFGDDLDEPEPAFEPSPLAPRGKAKRAKRQERRFRQTVQKVDLWSVTKMALCFYISAMGVLVVSSVALWVVADSAGIIDNVENFIGDLFSSNDFQFVSGQVLRGAVLIGVVLVALLVVLTIVAASFYNIFAELFGGIEIVIREEEQPPKR